MLLEHLTFYAGFDDDDSWRFQKTDAAAADRKVGLLGWNGDDRNGWNPRARPLLRLTRHSRGRFLT